MVIRIILRYLASNENLVNKLADSKPIRRAAQLCVYIYHRTKNMNHSYRFTDNPKELANQIISVTKRFSANLKKQLEDAKQEIQQKQKKPK